MTFPNQGVLKDLNPLEQNLLAARLPFMKLYEAPRGKQKFIHGNMVLVPADVESTVTKLPRLTSETSTIKATLKRKLKYKHPVYSLNIRPELVRKGAHFLLTKHLYRENVSLNEQWHLADIYQENDDDDPTLPAEGKELDTHQILQKRQSPNLSSADGDKNDCDNQDDNWSETDETEPTAGLSDTMLSAQDFIEPNERNLIYHFAPGERSIPVSVFIDKDAEELAFPGIFCGDRRCSNEDRPTKVTYGEIVKSELRNVDRRAACCVENIFFKAKKIQMKILIDQAHLMIRKLKTRNQPITVKDIKDNGINDLVHQDKAYKALASVRGSPPYFEKVSKDLFAMIRQLGPATFFVTLSAAETRWTHLLKILGEIVDGKLYSTEEIQAFSWEDKCRLIQSDPVTCARHFDFSVTKFLNQFLISVAHPIGEIQDFFYRVEYQHRGSPHIHMLVWCKDSPKYGEASGEELCEFIDKYISCFLPDKGDSNFDIISLQSHRHSHTCRQKKKKCRFGFPKPILKKTVILDPLSSPEFSKTEIDRYRRSWKKISDALNVLDETVPISLNDFLKTLQLSEDQYILSIRASIKRPTIFLKRSYNETRVNNYNQTILAAWTANMDIQFVLDVYACATYVASYLTKSQRGMSELLRRSTQEVKEGNIGLKQQVKIVGNKFLNAVEISAQEAVYLCLQLPMKRSSRGTVFVNTSPPEERVTLHKPMHILETMDDDDEDIECSSLLSRYSDRPKTMDLLTLAEFSSFYELKKKTNVNRNPSLIKRTVDKMLPEQDISENEDEDNSVVFPDHNQSSQDTQQYRRRAKGQIIRSVHFNPDTEPEKYFRELIMLYYPWRNEGNLLQGCTSYLERFQQLQTEIEDIRKSYEPYAAAVDIAERILSADCDQQDEWDELAPTTEHANVQDKAETETMLNVGIEEYDMSADLGLPISTTEEDLHDYNEMTDEAYRQHMRSLNTEQLEFVYDTVHHIKTSSKPIYRFLSGGAGVGKSFVTKALYQTALKYLNKQAGDNFTTRRVLLLAPTGKAAFHIQGTTIHSGLKIAANQKLHHKPLQCSSLNTLRNQIGSTKLLFIDEISMVGFNMLNCIHQRLMEVMQNSLPFGGLSVIAVGDLFQLKPVMDSYMFAQPTNGFLPLASNIWEDLFSMFELKQIMRQANNRPFAELLNRLREGKQTDEDLLVLQDRCVEKNSPDYPFQATHLFTVNERVNMFNSEVILRSDKSKVTVLAKDRVIGSTPLYMQAKILENFKNSKSKTCQLPNIVVACEGINYDITVNLNTADGLINGAACQLMKVDIPKSETYASGTLWVQFSEPSIGAMLRTESRHLYRRGFNKNWTPIQPVVKQFSAGCKGQAQIQRYQFPLRPAHAKTVHRSQGDTLDKAVIDLTMKRRVDHMHYVAVSRLQSLNGLFITNLQDDKISVDRTVVQEMKRLRNSPLILTQQFLYQVQNSFKLAFLNARSLHRHFTDIEQDKNILCADVATFCETRFQLTDQWSTTKLNNFIQHRQDYAQLATHQRPPYGLSIYSKSNFHVGPFNESTDRIEASVFTVGKHPDIVIVLIYKSPKASVKSLLNLLTKLHDKYIQASKAVILGDFNIDWNLSTSDKKSLQKLMVEQFHLKQTIAGPTNDWNSTIDLVFTNVDNATCGICENYYSDHKLIWISW